MTIVRSAGGISRGALVCVLLVMVLLTALALAARPDAGIAAGGCDTANVNNSTKQQLRKATICWVNQERTRRGKKPLRKKKKLQKAANKHIKVMINKRCFSHQCPGEADVFTRIKNTGYFSGARKFGFGENLGCAPSAKAMVQNWMQSDIHRKNILSRKFKHIGSAAATSAPFPRCVGGRGTFVHVFGFRKR